MAGLFEAKEHNEGFVQAVVGLEGSLPFITFLYPDIVEAPADIKLGEVLGAAEFRDEFWDERKQVLVLDGHGVQRMVILDQAELAILLFDEEDRRGHW